MTAILNALRWDVIVQARNGFYWASAFLIVVISTLLLGVPERARANSAVWVPAILVINLQITTFFCDAPDDRSASSTVRHRAPTPV